MTQNTDLRPRINEALQSVEARINAQEVRSKLLDEYNFRPEAQERIIRRSKVAMIDFSDSPYGSAWYPDYFTPEIGLVVLSDALFGEDDRAQKNARRGAVHEFAHVEYHERRINNLVLRRGLAEATVRLAEERNARYIRTIRIARGYVNGIHYRNKPDWPGMYAEGGTKVADIHNLTDEDILRVNDWEIFAGLASTIMGDLSQLPDYMRAFFEPLFETPPKQIATDTPVIKEEPPEKVATNDPETPEDATEEEEEQPTPEETHAREPVVEEPATENPAEEPATPTPMPEMPPQETDPDVLPQKPKEPTGPSGEIKRPLGAGHGCAFMVVLSKFFALVGKLLH